MDNLGIIAFMWVQEEKVGWRKK